MQISCIMSRIMDVVTLLKGEALPDSRIGCRYSLKDNLLRDNLRDSNLEAFLLDIPRNCRKANIDEYGLNDK